MYVHVCTCIYVCACMYDVAMLYRSEDTCPHPTIATSMHALSATYLEERGIPGPSKVRTTVVVDGEMRQPRAVCSPACERRAAGEWGWRCGGMCGDAWRCVAMWWGVVSG